MRPRRFSEEQVISALKNLLGEADRARGAVLLQHPGRESLGPGVHRRVRAALGAGVGTVPL